MFNLSNPPDRELLANRIKTDIDNYCAEFYHQKHRTHLGASIMGENCSRKLFYNFRWIKETKHDGRKQRLFQVGHQAEPRFIQYLKAIGFEVWEYDPDTKKQFRISGVNGHYGGSLDGKCKAPAHYNISEDLIFLNEFKTNGTGAGFANVQTKGVIKEKPKHYAQMCQYGWHYKLKYGLYLIENKNDSDIIIQIVELDWKLGQELENKASDIINSKFPPNRIAENPSFFDCKNCEYSGPCWFNEPVEINCRSCKFAQPIADAKWFCHRYQNEIPFDFIPKGCDGHSSINE